MSRRPNRTVLLLRDMPLFADCTSRQLELLGRVGDEVQLAAGTVLARQHDRVARDCFLIVTGRVAVAVNGQQLHVAGPGDLVGEMALLDGKPRRASLTTVTPTRVLSFGFRGFAQLRSCPSVARRMDELYLRRSGEAVGQHTTPTGRDQRPSPTPPSLRPGLRRRRLV